MIEKQDPNPYRSPASRGAKEGDSQLSKTLKSGVSAAATGVYLMTLLIVCLGACLMITIGMLFFLSSIASPSVSPLSKVFGCGLFIAIAAMGIGIIGAVMRLVKP